MNIIVGMPCFVLEVSMGSISQRMNMHEVKLWVTVILLIIFNQLCPLIHKCQISLRGIGNLTDRIRNINDSFKISEVNQAVILADRCESKRCA